jgi:serpin B
VAASNAFGFELYSRVKADQQNVVCAPVSASIALAMAWAGARGETRREMARVLALGATGPERTHAGVAALLDSLNARDGHEGIALHVADRLWGQKDLPFQTDYLRLLNDRYGAPLESVDFAGATEQARTAINRWAATQTHDRIREILLPGDVDALTRLVLTNAVYLKAAWQVEFTKQRTADGPFAAPDGTVAAKMMHNQASFRYARAPDVQILELDYRNGLSMVIVLPDAKDGLDAVEGRLAGSYAAWLKALDYKLIDLALPRWTVTSRLPLGGFLAAMGMPTAFSLQADFSGIATTRPLFIQKVLQQAFVNVDETGTEAAAVTAVAMATSGHGWSSARPIAFHADHPFLYLIRDRTTGAVLFIGRVVDPRSSVH